MDKISGLLSDEESVRQLSELAKMFMSESGEEAPEGMAVTDACKFHVEYPDVGIYSESTISDDALIGEHVIFDQDDRVFYVISADHKDSENIFIRTIKSYEVIMPYGFEDEAENTVTVEKVNDHTLKLTVAEDTELGFDLVTELFSTNKYYDHDGIEEDCISSCSYIYEVYGF